MPNKDEQSHNGYIVDKEKDKRLTRIKEKKMSAQKHIFSNGLTILLLSRIGFWSKVHRDKTPDSKYLLQVKDDSFFELASNSDYPIFSSSYFINRGEVFSDRINIPIADPECSADYYLVCLASEKNRYEPLFKHIHKDTIK